MTKSGESTTEPKAKEAQRTPLSGKPENLIENLTERKRLRTQIVQHLETYLSPQNLPNDPTLAKQAEDGKIAVSALSRIKVIKNLTSDKQLLLEAIKESSKFTLDPTQTHVSIKKERERTTLILREVSSDTPMEKVKALFDFPECPEIKDIHSDIGNNWFVTFHSEDDCLTVAMKLRTTGRFEGKPVKVRVKANLAQSEEPSTFQPSPYQAGGGGGGGGTSYVIPTNYPGSPGSTRRGRGGRMSSPRFNGRRGGGGGGGSYPASPRGPVGYSRGGYAAAPRHRSPPTSPRSPVLSYGQHVPPAPPFPRQPSAPARVGNSTTTDYPGDFRLYTPSQMMSLIKRKYGNVQAPKPASLEEPQVRDIVANKAKTMVSFHDVKDKVMPMSPQSSKPVTVPMAKPKANIPMAKPKPQRQAQQQQSNELENMVLDPPAITTMPSGALQSRSMSTPASNKKPKKARRPGPKPNKAAEATAASKSGKPKQSKPSASKPTKPKGDAPAKGAKTAGKAKKPQQKGDGKKPEKPKKGRAPGRAKKDGGNKQQQQQDAASAAQKAAPKSGGAMDEEDNKKTKDRPKRKRGNTRKRGGAGRGGPGGAKRGRSSAAPKQDGKAAPTAKPQKGRAKTAQEAK